MNLIVCILALFITFQGLTEFCYSFARMYLVKTAKLNFDTKVVGVVVKENKMISDANGSYLGAAMVEYTRKGETEIRCQKFDDTLRNTFKHTIFLEKGTLVDVWYNSQHEDEVFMTFHASIVKLFFTATLPGMLYITAGVLGFSYVFNI